MKARIVPLAMLAGALTLVVSADQVETRTGERYLGRIVSMDAQTVVLESESAGMVRLPRAKVAVIHLGTNAPPNRTNTLAASKTNTASPLSGLSSNLAQQVEQRFLASAPPEAREKFNELFNGLMNGSISVDDLRSQARSMAEQVRAHRSEMGENGFVLDSYLAILDRFIKDAPTATNSPAPRKTNPVLEEE